MSAKNSGPRARQKAETRRSLKEAARQSFAEQGYAATQVGDIARRARVAHGTFYVHFQTKEQLTDELLVEFNEALVARLERVWKKNGDQPPSVLAERVAEACLDYWARERELLSAFAERTTASTGLATLRDGICPPVAEFLVQRLRALAVSGGSELVDAELVAQALLGMWMRIGLRYVFGPRLSKKTAASLLARLSLGALAQVVPALALDSRTPALELP